MSAGSSTRSEARGRRVTAICRPTVAVIIRIEFSYIDLIKKPILGAAGSRIGTLRDGYIIKTGGGGSSGHGDVKAAAGRIVNGIPIESGRSVDARKKGSAVHRAPDENTRLGIISDMPAGGLEDP